MRSFLPLIVTALATCTPRPSSLPDVVPVADSEAAADVTRADSVPSACAAAATEALSAQSFDFYRWDGEGAESESFDWPLGAECGELRASAPWLRVEAQGQRRTVIVDPTGISSGIFRAELELRASDSTIVARSDVRLRVLRRPPAGAARKVLVVGFDGARSDAVLAANTPVIDFLLRRARSTFDATTQLSCATVSAPGWMSIFTGVDSSRHGVVTNGDYSARVATHRTFVARAVDAGRTAVVATAWEEVITQIVERSPQVESTFAFDIFAARWLATRLRTTDTPLFFMHLNDPDSAGHATGFALENPRYISAIEGADANLGVALDAVLARPTIAQEDWLVVLTTDHGGRGTMHGALDQDNRRIWFVASSPSLERRELAPGVSHMDTAPTVLRWLGVAIDPAWGLQGVSRVD